MGRYERGLTLLDLGAKPTTFELLAVRVVSGTSSCVTIVIYFTGVETSSFFTNLSDVLECVVTTVDPVYVVGDLNIQFDRNNDPSSSWRYLRHMALPACVRSIDRSGLLHVVPSHDDLSHRPSTSILSDHQLL